MLAHWKPITVLSAGVGLLLICQAVAQETRTQAQQRQTQQAAAEGHHKVCLASKLNGVAVKDKSDQAIGKIQDLVIDSQGQVLYLAIAAQAGVGAQGVQLQRQPAQQAQQQNQQAANQEPDANQQRQRAL
jgi:hypothetical protein